MGKNNQQQPPLEKEELQNYSDIIEMIAKNPETQLTIYNIDNCNNVTINHTQAKTAQENIKKEIDKLEETNYETKHNVRLHWYQARSDPKSDDGDRAIIKKICKDPVKTRFKDKALKKQLLKDSENPFTHSYLADVEVQKTITRQAITLYDLKIKRKKP